MRPPLQHARQAQSRAQALAQAEHALFGHVVCRDLQQHERLDVHHDVFSQHVHLDHLNYHGRSAPRQPERRAGPALPQDVLAAELPGAGAPQISRSQAQRQEQLVQVLGAEFQSADAPRSPRGQAQRQGQQRAQSIDAALQSAAAPRAQA